MPIPTAAPNAAPMMFQFTLDRYHTPKGQPMANLFDWSTTANNNTTVDGINIETNMSVANVDNAFRSMMKVIRASFLTRLEGFLAGSNALNVEDGGTGAATLTGLLKGNGTSAITAITLDGTTTKYLNANGAFAALPCSFQMKVTDDATALTAGTAKFSFRAPHAFTVTGVRASLVVAQTGGALVTVDINKNGSTILSTNLTFDNGESTTVTAATAAVISGSSIASDDVISIDIDGVGDGTAKGLTVTILGTYA
jgi:hypothetical protein